MGKKGKGSFHGICIDQRLKKMALEKLNGEKQSSSFLQNNKEKDDTLSTIQDKQFGDFLNIITEDVEHHQAGVVVKNNENSSKKMMRDLTPKCNNQKISGLLAPKYTGFLGKLISEEDSSSSDNNYNMIKRLKDLETTLSLNKKFNKKEKKISDILAWDVGVIADKCEQSESELLHEDLIV